MESSDESDYESKKTTKRAREINKKCPVKGCNSQSKDGIKFYNFPKDKKSKGRFSPLAKLWCFFTRIKDFQPISSQSMCELHFSDMCIATARKGVRRRIMKPKSVPTIYYNENNEKIEVPYDQQNMEYYGEEAKQIKQEINQSAILHHKEVTNLRNKRMQEIRLICRFCFTNHDQCLEMSKLKTYSINPEESLQTIGVSMQYAEAFNDIICANCFEKIVDFENYRRRCQNAQNELIREIEEWDRKVTEARNIEKPLKSRNQANNDDWFNIKVENKDENFDTEGDTDAENFENCNDFANDDDDDFFDNEMNPVPSIFNNSKEENTDVCQITIKSEPELVYTDNTAAEAVQEEENLQKSSKKRKTMVKIPTSSKKKAKIVENQPSTSTIETAIQSEPQQQSSTKTPKIKTPKNKRIFECFFCRLKFTGLRVFNTHECSVKRVKCEIEGCDSYFINQGGYNQHLHHRHNLPKVSKKFCPVCHTCFQMNVMQFDEHCKKCIAVNEYREQQIQCGQCKKICDNLQSYTAHIMLHDTKDLKPTEFDESGKPIVVKKMRRGKEDKMCDLCGKVFDSSGLQRHKLNVHFVNFTGEMFYCDLCPIAKPTKRLLYNHMKGTHIIKWHSCETCGKVFRNRELWRKHQLVHGDFKKNNRCDVCPHRPGFVTKAALNKHMRSNHGGAQPVRKFTCDLCRASYSRDDLLIRHRANVHQIYQNNYTDEIISQYIKY